MSKIIPQLYPTAKEALQRVFGFEDFRGLQEEVINATIAGGDGLVLMPTGGGKSLCYQIPALVRPGLAVVISPLIALMQNQVDALKQNGVQACFINSSQSPEEIDQLEREILNGEWKILYAAPERLTTSRFSRLLDQVELSLFAIDEAHCVSQWGHDFRPEYIRLSFLSTRYPDVPRLALTATADPQTKQEIHEKLNLKGSKEFISSFDRPNLNYMIQLKDKAKEQIYDFIQKNHKKDAGIVYCLSRKKVEELSHWLTEKGLHAIPYHAGLDAKVREKHQRRFLSEESIIMVATIAFGMGIDKPDVRFVCHLDLPKSLEAYYQETGRAGRDGQSATCLLLYNLNDMIMMDRFIQASESPDAQKQVEGNKYQSLLNLLETRDCKRTSILTYFGEDFQGTCGGEGGGGCSSCLKPKETKDATELAQKALSTIFRTGQRFGIGHLIQVLTGKSSPKIEQLGHDQLSTFGIGKNISTVDWKSVFRQLYAMGYIGSEGEFGGFFLQPKSKALLKGEDQFTLSLDEKPKNRAVSVLGRRTDFDNPKDQELFEELRTLRLQIARELGQPPYMVFNDRTLRSMAEIKPENLGEFHKLPGVGEAKLERFGADFLDVIEGFQ